MKKRELPADTYANLLDPPKDYRYFLDFEQRPLEADNREFNLANAWWMAEASLLAYKHDRGFVTEQLRRAGFNVKFIGEWGEKQRGTQAFLAFNSDAAILSFRGTDHTDFEDVITDVKTIPIRRDGYKVHEGFAEALDSVRKELDPLLADVRRQLPTGRAVFYTGHSLGAALATLAACELPAEAIVYNFGCPRVGNRAFCDRLEELGRPIFRFVNCQDAVTQIPPEKWAYRHAGTLFYFDRDGKLRKNPRALWVKADALAGERRHRKTATVRNPPFFVGNHSPGRYPILVWNSGLDGKG